jgi:hypothetical protein
MPRPRKPAEDRRDAWDVLYANAAERAEIRSAAQAAGLSVSRYLIAAHRGKGARARSVDGALIAALARAERHLSELATEVQAKCTPIDAVLLQAHLLSLERQFRHAVLPWSLLLDDRSDETAPC